MPASSTALAERPQQNPLVTALDNRMPALIEMLSGDEKAAKRFKRVVIQAVVRNPDLMKCTPNSIVDAVMESATLGIEPTGTLGGAYLVPYGQKATLIVGYRGLIELARRSGEIESIEARVVRDGDEFSYEYGTNAHVSHVPNLDGGSDRPLTYVYGVAKLRGGTLQFEVMTRAQVDAIRARSKSGQSGPWKSDYDEMARKTVVRRLVKYLPIAVEARDVIERDDNDFEPGAVVARVPNRADDLRQKLVERTAALRGEEVIQEPDPPDEPQETEPALDVDDIPFDAAVGALPDAEASQASSAAPAARCAHPAADRTVDHRGVLCGQCGALLAARGTSDDDELPDVPASEGRARLMARLHATLTHDQVKDIAASLLKIEDPEWSLADREDAELERIVRFLNGVSMEDATKRVSEVAVARGLVSNDADLWANLDVLATAATGVVASELEPEQWVAVGIRMNAGDFDGDAPARPEPDAGDTCPTHGQKWQPSASGKTWRCPVEGCGRRAAAAFVQSKLLAVV